MPGAVAILATGGAGLSATADPGSLLGLKFGLGTVYTDNPAIVTAQGGQVPYTYLWTFVSGDATVTPQLLTSMSTRFQAYFTAPGTKDAVYKCVVTDANTVTADTNTVAISLSSEP